MTMSDDKRASHSGLILNSAYFGQVSLVLSDEGRHWKLTASRLLMSGSWHGSPSLRSLGSRDWMLTRRLQLSLPWHSASSRLMGLVTVEQVEGLNEEEEEEEGEEGSEEHELLVSLYWTCCIEIWNGELISSISSVVLINHNNRVKCNAADSYTTAILQINPI